MSNFEESLSARLSTSKADPSATDLDYYAKPENYSGINMQSLQRFLQEKQKDEPKIEKEKEHERNMIGHLSSRYDTPPAASTGVRSVDIQSNNTCLSDTSNSTVSISPRGRAMVTEGSDLNVEASVSSRATPDLTYMTEAYSGGRDNTDFGRSNSLENQTQSELALPIQEQVSPWTANSPRIGARAAARRKLQKLGKMAQSSTVFSLEALRNPFNESSRSVCSCSPPIAPMERTEKARERFRHSIRLVIILLKWVSSLTQKDEESGGKITTFTDVVSEAFASQEMKNSGLTFDPSYYRANREINISNEVKYILSLPRQHRTPEQIQTALYGLQHLRSFAEYPLHMQEKLCKVALYEVVSPKRVIIRQGHIAENFYFILSGQAVVTIMEKNPKTNETTIRTATIMRKGMSFGELALLHHSRRTATVVSQDKVQLLTIGRDDFFDIFMSGVRPGEIPEHIKFVSTLDFMKDWPIEKLLDRPECCLFHFFKRGVVIVKDSTKSDWLYIVKSGTCQVMKELKSVKPHLGLHRSSEDMKNKKLSLPKLGTGEIESRIDNRRYGLRRQHTYVPRTLQQSMKKYSCFSKSRESTSLQKHWFSQNDVTAAETNLDQEDEPVNLVMLTSQLSSAGPGFSKSKVTHLPRTRHAHFSPSPTFSRRSVSPALSARSQKSNPTTPPKITSAEELEKAEETDLPATPRERKMPTFVQVELLKPRDVFGLTSIHFDDEIEYPHTVVSLVSRGAECIMLSKKFFIEHANELVKRQIRLQVRPYPAEEALQENLQMQVDWELYKKNLIRDLVVSSIA